MAALREGRVDCAIVDKDILGMSTAKYVSAVPLTSDLSRPVRMITFSASYDIPGLHSFTNELKEHQGQVN